MYRTVSLLVYTFGLVAFLGLFVLWLRQLRLGRPDLRAWHYPAIFLTSAAWFALNLLTLEYFILLAAACVFPPLLVRLFHARGAIPIAVCSAALAALSLLHQSGRLPLANPRRDLSLAFCAIFALACLSAARRTPGGRVSITLLVAIMALVPAAMFTFADWLSLAMRSLPLTILIVDSYARRRFLFLDLFAKWGADFAISLTALTFWFRLLPTSLHPIQSAILLLPVLYGVPRLCRTVGEVFDRHLLGRPFSAAEARRLFLEAIQTAPDEPAILSQAGAALSRIFLTRATVTGDGAVHLEPRADGRILFSEDLDLLDTLTVHLNNRLLEARRAATLVGASRSELKALRAQVDPHFLFNALNTVAGLIPSDPALAESTVEKLSDVFRYTLKRSGDEMALLADELDFLRAWLDVQQARFGARLQASIDAEPAALDARIPAMALQTLVENAVKHGVARATAPCQVEVSIGSRDALLEIRVTDSGPGPIDAHSNSGHGLANLRARLALYYGDRARLTLARRQDRTIATLEIPL